MKNFYLYLILIVIGGFSGYSSPDVERFICIGILALCLINSIVEPLAEIADRLRKLEELARGGK